MNSFERAINLFPCSVTSACAALDAAGVERGKPGPRSRVSDSALLRARWNARGEVRATYAEVAREVGLHVTSVQRRIPRALARARELLVTAAETAEPRANTLRVYRALDIAPPPEPLETKLGALFENVARGEAEANEIALARELLHIAEALAVL